MGRVSREQAARNRERVVQAACRLFRMHGVENVSIADVMSEAGLTVGAFHKQFESKDALISEAFALAFAQAGEAWTEVMKRRSGSPSGPLDGLMRLYFKQRPKEHNCPMLVFSSLVGSAQAEQSPAVSGGPAKQAPMPGSAADIYSNGVEVLFSQFHEQACTQAKSEDRKQPSESESMLLFSAMLGAGLLGWAIGPTPWIGKLQSAVLGSLPEE